MSTLKGTVTRPDGTFEIVLDRDTGSLTVDPFFDRWLQPGVQVREGGVPVDRASDPERWLRALAASFTGQFRMVLEEGPA